jgi:hypothetical protein
MCSFVEQKKECIRVALQKLDHPTCKMSTYAAMRILHEAICHDFDDDDSIGDFSDDDDFKEEIFSARVIQVVMDVSQDKKEYPPDFYRAACLVFYFLCSANTELATTFVANGGAEFLLERLEAFSSDQFVLVTCLAVYRAVIEDLDDIESAAFAGMTLEKLVDVFQLNLETADAMCYQSYCVAVGSSFGPGHEVNNNLYHRIVSHVWHGVIKHKHDEDAKAIGRCFLWKEIAKKMIEHAEMHRA